MPKKNPTIQVDVSALYEGLEDELGSASLSVRRKAVAALPANVVRALLEHAEPETDWDSDDDGESMTEDDLRESLAAML